MNKRLCSNLLIAISSIVTMLLVGCHSTPKGTNTGGSDTVGGGTTPLVPAFKSILTFDEEGDLSSIPFPCVDWLGGLKAIEAFEQEHGAKQSKDVTEGKKRALVYQTQDPKRQNPLRSYSVEPDGSRILSASVMIAADIIASGQSLNETMELLLHESGYKLIDSNKQPNTYTNGTFTINFSSFNESLWLITYMPARDPLVQGGIQMVKDFPFLKKQTAMEEYTFDEIHAYETNLGLRKRTKRTPTEVTYEAIDPTKLTLQKVVYHIYPKGTAGKTSGPMGYTKVFTIDMISQPEVRQYLMLNGFEYEKDIKTAGTTVYVFKNKPLAVRIYVATSAKDETIVSFSDAKDLYDNGGTVDPNNREQLYLPLLEAIGTDLNDSNPVIEKEKARGFQVTFKPAGTDSYGDYPAKIEAIVPTTSSYNLPGITSIQYTTSKLAGDLNKILEVVYLFNTQWNKKKITGEDQLLVDFLNKHGFVYKKKEDKGGFLGTYWQFYNETLALYFEYNLSKDFAVGTFRKTPLI